MKLHNLGYGVYIGGIIYYNVYSIYFNGKKELTNYRKNKIYFIDEMESVVYGCQKDWYHNLLSSFFWPITVPFKLVPLIIFSLNNGKSNEDIINNNEVDIKYRNITVLGKKDLKVIKSSIPEKTKENIPEKIKENENIPENIPDKPNNITDIFPEHYESGIPNAFDFSVNNIPL